MAQESIPLDMTAALVRVDSSMFALSLIMVLVLAAGPAANDVNPNAPQIAPYGRFASMTTPPTKEWSIALPSPYCVGVTPVQDTLMWVSAGQSNMKIYVYNIKDPARPLVDSFPQGDGPTGWGIRDMAFKASTNEVFAGYDNQKFNVYDATTHERKHTYMVSRYSGVVRGFAYSPYQDSCWTCDFDSAPMTKFSINGANGHAVRPLSEMPFAYGLAFDRYQHCFWVTQAGAVGASPTLKMDFAYNVVDSFNAEGWDQGGGCEMWKYTFLLQLNQSSPDEVYCMRFVLSPLPDHDVGVSAIIVPPANINPGSFAPKARVMNFGANSEAGIPLTCWIDSSGTLIYAASETLPGPLGPGLEAVVGFAPNWTSGPVGALYSVTMFTSLPGDENVHDDTTAGTTAVTGAILADTVHVRSAGSVAPTIDGNMTAGEWDAADVYDFSDLAGRGGTPQPAGSCLARFLYDSAFVYLATECPYRTTRVPLDQFGPFMDEDGNSLWASDSSEGGYALEYSGSDDQAIYSAALDTMGNRWEMGPAPGALSASSLASGHLQFEARIPIGVFKWQWSISGGDVAGLFQYASLDSSRTYVGWWPQSVTLPQWPNPRYYGTMIFDSLSPGVVDRTAGIPFALRRAGPSLVRDRVLISYYVGGPADVRLAVYDAAGSLVRTLVSGRLTPGERSAAWDRTDNSGRRVADGTYFYRLVVDGRSLSGKAIILH